MGKHHFQWKKQLFLWPCSIGILVYQRVANKASTRHITTYLDNVVPYDRGLSNLKVLGPQLKLAPTFSQELLYPPCLSRLHCLICWEWCQRPSENRSWLANERFNSWGIVPCHVTRSDEFQPSSDLIRSLLATKLRQFSHRFPWLSRKDPESVAVVLTRSGS